MKLSKPAKRLLSRFLKNHGDLTLNEYSQSYYTMYELKEAGLVEYDSRSQFATGVGRYDHCYMLTAEILDDADDIEFYMGRRKYFAKT